jgi:hypothetical protein
MTTAQSPIHALRAQAERIASTLKAVERGENVVADRGGKLAAARAGEGVTFAVVMDDKIIKITMPWSQIRKTSRAGIVEFIVNQTRGPLN